MMRFGASLLLAGAAAVSPAASADVQIATFDGASATTRAFAAVNDPVMGGQSASTFKVDASRKVGVWDGEVKVVPFLHAPGFCNLMSPGLHKKADFPDMSGASGLVARMSGEGLTHFNVMLMTKGVRHLFQEGQYIANLTTLTSEMADHFVPWSAFVCTHYGQPVKWCPDLKTQLSQVDSVGFGTTFPGSAGKFHVEIESLKAGDEQKMMPESELRVALAAGDEVVLADFGSGSAAKHTWHSENDPVMGGQSSSSFAVGDGYGIYKGSCRIVPKLQAPGFTIAMTEGPLTGHFADVSSMDGLLLGLRNAGGNVTSFKFAFCDSRINFKCQFKSFKADFELKPSSDFQEVFLPWSLFSDKWSASTGKHTAEEPPSSSSLRSVTQLQLWTEGVLGDFEVHVKYVKAAKRPQPEPALLV